MEEREDEEKRRREKVKVNRTALRGRWKRTQKDTLWGKKRTMAEEEEDN